MKKLIFLSLASLSILNVSGADGQTTQETDVKALVSKAKTTENKLPKALWNYQLNEKDDLFDPSAITVDNEDLAQLKERYDRMLHATFLKSKDLSENLNNLHELGQHMDKIAVFVEDRLVDMYGTNVAVENISVYGSFLYMPDPGDVDLQVVVDSPVPIYEHIELPATTILSTLDEGNFPEISLQIIDYQTFVQAKENYDTGQLSRSERIALQQLAFGAEWFYTMYGQDLRFDTNNQIQDYKKDNYLFRAFDTYKAAGARLYKSVYDVLPPESDRVRLRKVLSRLMITDFLINALDKKMVTSPKVYDQLYDQIRAIKEDNGRRWISVEKKIEHIYFQKLKNLLELSEQYGHIEDVELVNK